MGTRRISSVFSGDFKHILQISFYVVGLLREFERQVELGIWGEKPKHGAVLWREAITGSGARCVCLSRSLEIVPEKSCRQFGGSVGGWSV